MKKKQYILLISVLTFVCIPFNLPAMKISGSLNIKKSSSIIVETIGGKKIIDIPLSKSGAFESGEVDIVPDIYIFSIGVIKETVFIDNTDIEISGYLDPSNAKASQLKFSGLDANSRYQILLNRCKESKEPSKALSQIVKEGKSGRGMISALAYPVRTNLKAYEDYKEILGMIPVNEKNDTYFQLNQIMDSLYQYRLGASAPDFSLTDVNGKTVKLSDFKGKYVLVDFWASWCGPCKAEMKKLKPIYEKHKDKNIIFISVSLDDTKDVWLKAMEHEQIPWLNLWDKSGFNNTSLKGLFGFKSIPFIMLVDPQGIVLARNIRGAVIDNELNKIQ